MAKLTIAEAAIRRSIARRHRYASADSWLGAAVLGSNDGLESVFGLVLGVAAGSGGNRHVVLLAALSEVIPAAMSMGSGELLEALTRREQGSRTERPALASVACGLSTGIGGVIPALPFFFSEGRPAVIMAAAVTLACMFGVGAAKCAVTGRVWWLSGLQMAAIGVATGVVTYAVMSTGVVRRIVGR
jgi:VIT1/CCC1 family predicted Fe2+/Mn2+ transporter